MSAGLDKLGRYIGRLRQTHEALKTPTAFFAGQAAEYVEIAQRITKAVLQLARPPEIEPKEWDFRIDALAQAIGTELVRGEEVGLMIFLDARQFEQLQFEAIASGTFAKDTVLAWVRAGRAEDPIGKQFDDRDMGDSDETIASRVWWALYTGRSRHSAEHIRKYLTGKTEAAVMEHLPAVLSAWLATLRVVALKDWQAWVRKVIKSPAAASP